MSFFDSLIPLKFFSPAFLSEGGKSNSSKREKKVNDLLTVFKKDLPRTYEDKEQRKNNNNIGSK